MSAALSSALSALFALVVAAAIGVAAYLGGWLVVAAGALCVLCLAAGWGALVRLPHPSGTALLVAVFGAAAVLLAHRPGSADRPLSQLPALLAAALLLAFAHELLRRDGRGRTVESVTGTLTGQVVAVQAAGWLLLAGTTPGWHAVLVAAVSVVAALVVTRLAGALPLADLPLFGAWAGIGSGLVAALVASLFVTGVPALTAAVLGAGVAGVGVTLDRLLAEPARDADLVGILAWAAAPVAAAGTVAYTVVRIGVG